MTNALHLAPPLTRGLLDNYATPDFFLRVNEPQVPCSTHYRLRKKASVCFADTGTPEQNGLCRSTALQNGHYLYRLHGPGSH